MYVKRGQQHEKTAHVPYPGSVHSSFIDGKFKVNLPAGNYRLEITANRYLTFFAYATVENGKITAINSFEYISDPYSVGAGYAQ